MRRYATLAAIVGCLLAGGALVLLGVDLARWHAALRADDVTYRAAPERGLWAPQTFLPSRVSRSLLGVGDDVAYRDAVRAFRLARIDSPVFSDPATIVQRNEAAVRLNDVVQRDSNAFRRSAAANLLGAIAYSDALSDFTNRAKLIVIASQRFGQAISLDPGNDDAKYNLELTLALGRAQGLQESGGGQNPAPGGKGAKGAGAGAAGSGF